MMRDVIWTLIVVWLIYRLVDVFKAATSKKSFAANAGSQRQQQQHTSSSTAAESPKKDIKSALQKHLNKEGEYVDFEEIK